LFYIFSQHQLTLPSLSAELPHYPYSETTITTNIIIIAMEEERNHSTPSKETNNENSDISFVSVSSKDLFLPLQDVVDNSNMPTTTAKPPVAVTPDSKIGTKSPTKLFAVTTPEAKLQQQQHPNTPITILSSLVDLDISIDTTNTMVPFASIVEAAMENYQHFDKDSSKLSQVWLACDENNKQISMEDALAAAVTDLMNLQSLLLTAERKVADYEAAALLPTREDLLLAQIHSLQIELQASKKVVSQQANQKQRMIANFKKKKALMAAMETRLAVAEKDLTNLSAENGTLRAELAMACDARDSCKNKLRSLNEVVQQSRTCIGNLEKRLRRTEQARALEGELLDSFRKLAIHTG
jgi:hypothetical protein